MDKTIKAGDIYKRINNPESLIKIVRIDKIDKVDKIITMVVYKYIINSLSATINQNYMISIEGFNSYFIKL